MEPTKYIALAYMTGILPIKKYKTQSAMNNFDEYTMLDPDFLAPYVGFTETEVKVLCERYQRNFTEVKRWYDGYELEGYHVYNPSIATKLNKWSELISFQKESRALLEAVLDEDTEAVSEMLEKIYNQYTSVIEYNNENSLSSVLTVAFLSTLDYFIIK